MRTAILGVALATVAFAVPAAQQTGAPRLLQVVPASISVRAGEAFEATLALAVGADAPADASMLVDGVGLLQDGFVLRGFRVNLLFCPTFRCVPCPDGTQCFGTGSNIVDPRTPPGRHTLPITVTDARGRVARVSLDVVVTPPLDTDADGLPDTWETTYGLDPRIATGDDGPDGDPDGDGVRNRDEFGAFTAPRGRYRHLFAEASAGDRPPGIVHCFEGVAPSLDGGRGWLTLIGDDGRRSTVAFGTHTGITGQCALPQLRYPADRVVAAIVESEKPAVIERNQSTYGVDAPSRRWLFADGGTDGELDTFYLAYNPNAEPVVARFTYRLPSGAIGMQTERELPPGRRTTTWVNADHPSFGRREASVEVEASAPILLERAWRFDPPGRTVTQAAARPGVAAPSARWYFGELDASLPFDSTLVIANPEPRPAHVMLTLFFADRGPVRLGSLIVAAGSRVAYPVKGMAVLRGDAAALEVASINGVGVVAERSYSGRDQYGPWRETAGGATELSTRWTVGVVYGYAQGIALVNPSSDAAQVQIDFTPRSHSGEVDSTRLIEVPARQRVVWRADRDPLTATLGTVRIRTLTRRDGKTPQIFVERHWLRNPLGGARVRPGVLPGAPVR